MADLSYNQRALEVQLVCESTDVQSKITPNRDLQTSDICNTIGLNGAITVGTVPVEVKVGLTNLDNRKAVLILNNGAQTIYWGFDNTVSTANGFPVFKNQYLSFEIGSNVSLWLVSSLDGQDVRVVESA